MRKSITVLATIPILFICSTCFADLFIEQNCSSVTKSKSVMTGWSEIITEYKRRLFVIENNFLAVQLVVNDIPTKEYGFDFKNEFYYEADLLNDNYKQYTFSRINEEYAKIKTAHIKSSPQMNIAKALFSSVAGGFVDYRVKSGKSLFRRKKIADFECALYKYKIGPGYSAWSPMSWGKEATAWVTKDIPNYSEYKNVINDLKNEGMFYKAKSNEISDFIIMLMYTDGYPLETYANTKRDFGMATSIETSAAVFSTIETGKILSHRLSYFRDTDKFIINPEEQQGLKATERLRPGLPGGSRLFTDTFTSVYRGQSFLAKFYAYSVPIVFYLGLIAYIIMRFKQRTSEAVGSKLVFRFYCLFALLYLLQIVHVFVPYFKSVELEFSAILILGAMLILGIEYMGVVRERKLAMKSTHAKVCPHCKAVIDGLCAVCPKCDKSVE